MDRCLIFSANNYTNNAGLGISRAAGAHRIANELRANNWDAEVIDFFFMWSDEELHELIRSRLINLKWVGISFTSNIAAHEPKVISFLTWLRDNYPHIKIIAGGHKPAIDVSWVDYYIAGFGENALLKLLKYLFDNGEEPLNSMFGRTRVINGDTYKSFPHNNPTIIYEKRDFIQAGEWGYIEFSRGCKFNCNFCDFPNLGVKYDATRSGEGVREQMMHAYDNYGIEHYCITDNTFNDYTDKISKYADVVETLPWKPYFGAFTRADLIIKRPRDREEMLRMGVLSQAYGVESFNKESCKYMGKGGDPEKLKEGLDELNAWYKQRVGDLYRPTMYLIAGLPYETKESLEKTIEWVKTKWFPRVSFMQALEISKEQSDFTRSTLSREYHKLGYREIDADDKSKVMNWGAILKDEEQVIWENDNMNLYEASNYAEDFKQIYLRGKNISVKRLQTFIIQTIMVDDNGVPLDLSKKLSLTTSSAVKYIENTENIFIKNYINNKLSL